MDAPTFHEPPDAICVDLSLDGKLLPDTERYFIVPDLVVNGCQIQLPYATAKELGLTPTTVSVPQPVPTTPEIDLRVFRKVNDLTEIAKKDGNVIAEVWDGIHARCQRTTNEA